MDIYVARTSTLDPFPKKRHLSNVCMRHDHTPELKALVKLSASASRKARDRMRALASMSAAMRRKAWNDGPEKKWFGPYRKGSPGDFEFVRERIERVRRIFKGTLPAGRKACANKENVLTIRAFNCSDAEFRGCRDGKPPAPPRDKACCNHKSDAGWTDNQLVVFTKTKEILYDQPLSPRPHVINIGTAWFRRPRGLSRKAWQRQRRTTVLHEVAHLAGAWAGTSADPAIPDDERYGRATARHLARANPRVARINAENYAYYILEIAD
ncbi:M35 family metallo-endopeptidase [Aestuariibius sp. 2305UL40-4]|uniref:M35 family metallo-endopeptidase n=1 Tax=Aestuariibius violaceus TaxID=3234132 RepID=UPI00345EB903